MCTHEVWTYPECGCTIDHHRRCSGITDVPSPSPRSSPSDHDADCPRTPAFPSRPSRFGTWNNGKVQSYMPMATSPVHLPPSPSPTPPDSDSDTNDSNPEDYYHSYLHGQTSSKARHDQNATEVDSVPWSQYNNGTGSNTSLRPGPVQATNYGRQCSINHTTYKTFLEPICDDCLLDELGVQQHSEAGTLTYVSGAHEHSEQTGNEDGNGQLEKAGERGRARHTRNGSGLIWSSNIQIEITPSPTSTDGPAEDLASESGNASAAATAGFSGHVSTPEATGVVAVDGGVRKRSLPFTHDPNKRISSTIDLARRRPWLVKELEAYLNNDSFTTRTSWEKDLCLAAYEKDTEILESSVKVEVLNDSCLSNALASDLLSPVSCSRASSTYPFPSTPLPYARPLSAIDTTSPVPTTVGGPHHHRNTLSASTFTADADDESSLHTSSPTPATSHVLSPNVTQRRSKPRSNTKVVRRRGMDISRSSFALRISSRWGSAERECLEGFKDDLLGRSPKHEEKVEFRENALDISPSLGLRSEHENKKHQIRDSDQKSDGKATSNNKHKHGWSHETLEHLNDIQMDQDQLDVNAPEAGDAVDVDADPVQPAPIKLHRDTDFIKKTVPGDAGVTPMTGRHRSRSPVKNLLTRFVEAQNGGKTWAQGVLGDLKRSMSRDSRSRGRGGRDDAGQRLDVGSNADFTMPAGSATPGVCTLRAVVDSFEDIGQTRKATAQSQTSQDTGCTRRESAQTSDSEPSGPVFDGNLYLHPAESQSIPASSESWQAHLSHDLTLPRNSKQHLLRNAGMSKSEVRLPIASVTDRQGEGLPRRTSSAATMHSNFMSSLSPLLSSVGHDYPLQSQHCHQYGLGGGDEESQRRLLSPSSGPSIPITASSTSSRTWVGHQSGSGSGSSSVPPSGQWKWKGERLASIVSSSEFEIDDELVGTPWDDSKTDDPLSATAGSPADQVVERERTLPRDISDGSGETAVQATTAPYQNTHDTEQSSGSHTADYHQQLPRPRNPTPSSAPAFRFKPHLQPPPTPSKSARGLTKHPLSTPLRISTPNRPILPLRTSSLSSPPMSTPTTVGLPASTTTLTHSPTENFACIWKRYLCAGVEGRGPCGRMVGEEVVSCICGVQGSESETEIWEADMGGIDKDEGEAKRHRVKAQQVTCRSTAPVVRYVENTRERPDQDDGKEVMWSPSCEQCRHRA